MSGEENQEAFLCPGSQVKKAREWDDQSWMIAAEGLGKRSDLRAGNKEVTSDIGGSGLREARGTGLMAQLLDSVRACWAPVGRSHRFYGVSFLICQVRGWN